MPSRIRKIKHFFASSLVSRHAVDSLVLIITLLMLLVQAACSTGLGFNASIDVAGQVVDEQGNSLRDLKLSTRHSRITLLTESFSESSESEITLHDGNFNFACNPCSSAQLHFSKPGYYTKIVNFSVRKPNDDAKDRADSGEAIDPRDTHIENVTELDLRIVLLSNKNKVRLDRYEGMMETTNNGPLRVMPLRMDLGGIGVPIDFSDKPHSKTAKFLGGYVQLLAQTNSDGDLAARPRLNISGAQSRIPTDVILDFSHADGGIQLFKSTEEASAEIFKAMPEAPEAGYQQSITLETQNIQVTYYFFCRIGQWYGKGLITVPYFGSANDDGREVVRSYIRIWVNPDGSRNLETGR
jgi:hypothetical protein